MGRQKHEREPGVAEQNADARRREVKAEELVEVLGGLMEHAEDNAAMAGTLTAAEDLLERLVGPERATNSRLSSRHLICDRYMCEIIAGDLGIDLEPVVEVFEGEPYKRAMALASWILDEADEEANRLMNSYEKNVPRHEIVRAKVLETGETHRMGKFRNLDTTYPG